MSGATETTTLVLNQRRTKARSGGLIRWLGFLAILLLLSGGTLWATGYRPGRGFDTAAEQSFATVTIQKGDIRVMVLESGSLESAENATVKCQVESILGTVGANVNGMAGTAGGGRGGNQGNAQPVVQTAAVVVAATKSAGGMGVGKVGAARTGGGTSANSGTGMTGAGGGAGGGGGTNLAKPQIQSFTMQVIAHQPLRPKTATTAAAKGQKGGAGGMMGAGGAAGGRGGGGGGGNRGGGQNDPNAERQGSTTILKLVPEGSTVSAGEIVCVLDSAAFRDELQSQLIRWEQAKSWVNQAREVLKVSQIALREYREGIMDMDTKVLEKYIAYCRTQLAQKKEDTKWALSMVAQHLLSGNQLKTAQYSEEQSRIVLAEAEGMMRRLTKFTAPRLLRNLEAKISAVEADLLAQESSLQLEDDRKRKLEKMIELCTLRAPREGLVAYSSSSTGPGWNPTAVPIAEGVTVRQGQTILLLPNAKKMRAKVRVNESKVSSVFPGQRATMLVEAFPNKPLTGRVTEITGIPAPANGMASDVRLYYANVDIEDGAFEGLRTGLSAQVAFFIDQKKDVPKIRLDAIRWVEGQPYAAVPRSDRAGFDWRSIELGLVGSSEAEIKAGLKVGDRVIAQPEPLMPGPLPLKKTIGVVAVGSKGDPASF